MRYATVREAVEDHAVRKAKGERTEVAVLPHTPGTGNASTIQRRSTGKKIRIGSGSWTKDFLSIRRNTESGTRSERSSSTVGRREREEEIPYPGGYGILLARAAHGLTFTKEGGRCRLFSWEQL